MRGRDFSYQAEGGEIKISDQPQELLLCFFFLFFVGGGEELEFLRLLHIFTAGGNKCCPSLLLTSSGSGVETATLLQVHLS